MRRMTCLLILVCLCVASQCQTGQPCGFAVPNVSPFDGVWVARQQPPGYWYDDIDMKIIISDGATRGVWNARGSEWSLEKDDIATLGDVLIIVIRSLPDYGTEHRYELQPDGQTMIETPRSTFADDHPDVCAEYLGLCIPLIFDRQ